MPPSALISVLARSLIASEPDVQSLKAGTARTLGRDWPWLQPLASRYLKAFANRTRPRHRDAVRFLLEDPDFRQALAKYGSRISIAEWVAEPQRMQPVAAAKSWKLPEIESAGDLANWLSLYIRELEWLADLKGLGYKYHNDKLRHYRYHILSKRSGGVRLIESPKSFLKDVQRRILTGILDRIPPHPAAHGFTERRSIVTFAAPHVSKGVLLRLDLQDFFPSFPASRVQAVFRTLGYPDGVSSLLAGLCTNSVPQDIWSNHSYQTRMLYARPHLPQGAPTSPALANITAYRLDCRLSGLARTAGAVYTRYADDIAFSGDEEFSRVVKRFPVHAAAIAIEEGFSVNHRKTRVFGRGQRQHLASLVVNDRVGVPRADLELLEATLTNCVRSGPAGQNRENVSNFRAHLQGRIGFVEMVNPEKARKLRALFGLIVWKR